MMNGPNDLPASGDVIDSYFSQTDLVDLQISDDEAAEIAFYDSMSEMEEE